MGVEKTFKEERNATLPPLPRWLCDDSSAHRNKSSPTTPFHQSHSQLSRWAHFIRHLIRHLIVFQTIATVFSCYRSLQLLLWLLLRAVLGASSAFRPLNGMFPSPHTPSYFLLSRHTLLYPLPHLETPPSGSLNLGSPSQVSLVTARPTAKELWSPMGLPIASLHYPLPRSPPLLCRPLGALSY